MKRTTKLINSGMILGLILSSTTLFAAPADETVANITVEKRVYQYDGYGAQWAMDTGSDGLWFVPKRPVGDVYSAPIKIRNNAKANTLVVGTNDENNVTNGFVGIGTDEPTTLLHTNFNDASTKDVTELIALSVDNTNTSAMSDTGFKLSNVKEGVDWTFRTLEDDALIPSNHNAFAISKKASGAKELIITANDDTGGMKMILANGASCVAGNWVNASSRALKENIEELSAADAMDAFHALKPVTYNYKVDKTEKVVGFIAEDVPNLVAVNARNGLSPMDMVALLTKVVQEQDKKIQKLEAMQKRLAKVESLLTNLALDTSKDTQEKVSLK